MAAVGVIRPPIILAKDKVTLGFSQNMTAIHLHSPSVWDVKTLMATMAEIWQ